MHTSLEDIGYKWVKVWSINDSWTTSLVPTGMCDMQSWECDMHCCVCAYYSFYDSVFVFENMLTFYLSIREGKYANQIRPNHSMLNKSNSNV